MTDDAHASAAEVEAIRAAWIGDRAWRRDVAARDDIATLLRALDAAQADAQRFAECMRRAGLAAFMRDRDPSEVADHLRDVIASYEADAQRERERAEALQRCLGERAPDEPASYAQAVGAAMREGIASVRAEMQAEIDVMRERAEAAEVDRDRWLRRFSRATAAAICARDTARREAIEEAIRACAVAASARGFESLAEDHVVVALLAALRALLAPRSDARTLLSGEAVDDEGGVEIERTVAKVLRTNGLMFPETEDEVALAEARIAAGETEVER